MHAHLWNQFVYATTGTLMVTVADAWYVITPEQAIWIPTGVEHTSYALDDAEFRNLYITDGLSLPLPDECTVLSISPLLRALIVELDAVTGKDEEGGYLEHIDALILDQLCRQKVLDFHLPWPQSPALHKICEALYLAPNDARTIDQWGAAVGASPRTLARHFEKEVGMSLRLWRHRLRLFRAMEWLGAGQSVTDIALELGYGSTSAFSYAFRKEMGCSPTEWLIR
jgi:AraC-like DNA-binding protein